MTQYLYQGDSDGQHVFYIRRVERLEPAPTVSGWTELDEGCVGVYDERAMT